MCSNATLAQVRAVVAEWAARFDAAATTVADCRRVVAETAAMQSALAAVQAEAAARVAESASWREEGERSAAHQIARDTGSTLGAARAALETGQRLRQLPRLAEAARAGLISAEQTAAVAAVGAVAPDLVEGFIERAQQTGLSELREETARAAAARHPDPDGHRRRLRDARSLRHWIAPSGAGVVHYEDAPDVIAGLMAQLAPIREGLFTQARERGEQVRPDALDADALLAAVTAGAASGQPAHGRDATTASAPVGVPHRCAPRAKILVRVDFDTLLRGRPIDGEICEIAGYGPIAVAAVRDMLATGDPFLTAIVTKGKAVVGVAHIGRKALSHQATALEWTNPTCAVDGCTRATRLEIDHRIPWATSKITLTELLDRLCEHHHDLKTREDWALIDGHGKREFVNVKDPRHPRNPLGLARARQARGDPLAG